MKLKAILKSHGDFAPKGVLVENLGDGFLLHSNFTFRQVRKQALKLDLKFSKERFHDYDALSLTQLPKILESGIIPYCDNVRPLLEIEIQAPGVFEWSEVPPLRANYVLHETAHALARKLSQEASLVPQDVGKKSSEQKLVLLVLLEEAFSNACESMANADAEGSLHDEFLYKNSYVMEKPAVRKRLRDAIHAHGRPFIFRLLLLSFLHANFVKTQMASIDFKKVLALCDEVPRKKMPARPASEIKKLEKVFQIGFDLDPAFTLFTNAFCLRLMGMKTELLEALDFDFLRLLSGTNYQHLLFAMSDIFNEKETP